MKKIFYCASVWIHIRNFHLPFIRELEREGWEVHVGAAGIPDDAGLSHPYSLPIEKSVLSLTNTKAIFRLVRLFRRERYDLIYVHTTLAAFLCRVALWLSRIQTTRLVYLCHGYFFSLREDGRVKRDIRSLAYLACEKLLARRTHTLALMNREDFLSARRYRLSEDIRFSHGMGLVSERYRVEPAEREGEGAIFLCVGEFSPRKNQQELIRAFASVRESLRGCALWFAGDGKLLEECKALAKELGIGEQVRFFGHTGDVSELYNRADAVVSASKSEGLPFCVMESLHFGLPVIATDIKGHRDLISHGINGWLYSPGDGGTLANYLQIIGKRDLQPCPANSVTLSEKYYISNAIVEFWGIIN